MYNISNKILFLQSQKDLTNLIIDKMKKSGLIVCTMVVAAMVSCGNKPGKVSFNNSIDTVSYSIGLARTNGFIEYLSTQMGVDTAYMKDFVKGFYEGAKMANDGATKAYLAGLQIGQQEIDQAIPELTRNMFGDSTDIKLNIDNYSRAFIAGTTKDYSVMTMEKADFYADSLYNAFTASRVEKQYAANKAEGEAFLASKAKEEGVVATGSGLLYKVITAGKGAMPTVTDKVKVNYKGTLVDGTLFDKSNEPAELRLSGVIKGWTEALQLMSVGSKWELYIPYQLGYGDQENTQSVIKPYSALIFEVELLSIEK